MTDNPYDKSSRASLATEVVSPGLKNSFRLLSATAMAHCFQRVRLRQARFVSEIFCRARQEITGNFTHRPLSASWSAPRPRTPSRFRSRNRSELAVAELKLASSVSAYPHGQNFVDAQSYNFRNGKGPLCVKLNVSE